MAREYHLMDGRVLARWARLVERQRGVDMCRWLRRYGKQRCFPARIDDWSEDEVGLAYPHAARALRARLRERSDG